MVTSAAEESDPYFEVKSEVLAALSLLRQSQGQSSSASVVTSAQLKETYDTLLADLDELDESVAALLEPGIAARLGISTAQVQERERFLQGVKRELEDIRRRFPELEQAGSSPRAAAHDPNRSVSAPGDYFPPGSTIDQQNRNPDAQDEFEMHHQTLLLEQQDRTLLSIGGTVDQLRDQARTMGREVGSQNLLLDELDAQVDRTGSKLERAQRRMDKFIGENKNSASSWTIFGLIVILCILLFIILFV